MAEPNGQFLGKNLGNYTLTRLLGAGGFAEVYLGVHKHLETHAAIKVLKAQLNEREQQGFIAEARTVARLKHPYIIRILEFGIEDAVPFLIMHYAVHGTLRRYFPRNTSLELPRFLPYLKQIASALQYAHDQGLIHRDIKPENMLLDENDAVFLSDFGIATQARSSRSQSVEEVMGTVVYMAPEQLQGKPRPASDQYSLAVVTYEWLCGTRPFYGPTYIDISMQHLKAPPRPLREHVPTIQPAVEQVVLKALAKDPHWRYARVQDFVDALELAHTTGRYRAPQDFAPSAGSPSSPLTSPSQPLQTVLEPTRQATPYQFSPQTPHTPPAPPHPSTEKITNGTIPSTSRRTLIGAGIGAGVLAVGGITWWITTHQMAQHGPGSSNPSSRTPSTGLYLPHAKLLSTFHSSKTIFGVAWSHDGKAIATGGEDNTLSVWRPSDGTKLWSVSVSPIITALDWSPDGTKLAVNNGTHIQIYHAVSHELRATSSFPGGKIAWSPDSQLLAVAGVDLNTTAALWDGNSAHTFTPSLQGYDIPTGITWRPDGQYLAGSFTSPDGANGAVAIWKKGANPSTPPQSHSHPNGAVEGISWSSASENYLASATSEEVEILDADTLGNNYSKQYPQFAHPAVWSPDGRYVASATPLDNTVQIWNGSTANVASICQGLPKKVSAIAWSKDGNYLATVTYDNVVRIWHVRS